MNKTPQTEPANDDEVIYEGECPWSISCHECHLTMREGEVFQCPKYTDRQVLARHMEMAGRRCLVLTRLHKKPEERDDDDQ